MTFIDENFEYWYLIYSANKLQDRNITFEVFMQAPREIMEALTFGTPMPNISGSEYLPLLPRQEAVRADLERQDLVEVITAAMEALPGDHNVLEMHGDRMIEPMHRRVPFSRKKVGFGRGVANREGC